MAEVVERRTGDLQQLEVSGLALDVGLPAPISGDPAPRHWLALRDSLSRYETLLVRSTLSATGMRTRQVTARVVDDPQRAELAASLLREGRAPGSPDEAAHLHAERLLVELDGGDARELASVGELRQVPAGTVVRLTLRFPGHGLATCRLDDACRVQQLGAGEGRWLQVGLSAFDAEGVLVETAFPPSVFPVHLFGWQKRAPEAAEALLDGRVGSTLLGWAHVLRAAGLDQDPSLPVDRLWFAPLILGAAALLLLIGLRIGYPLFRHEGAAAGASVPLTAPIPVLVSGRLGPPDGALLDVVEASGRLGPPRDAPLTPSVAAPVAELVLQAAGRPVTLVVPPILNRLTAVERGSVVTVSHRRPAIWLHWYRSDAQLIFRSGADRDAAEALLLTAREPEPAAPAEPPPPRPVRRTPSSSQEDEPERWRPRLPRPRS